MPADVTINLEERGLECSGAESRELMSLSYYAWSCRGEKLGVLMEAEIRSTRLGRVDYISARAYSPLVELAAPFLGFVATMPYDNADPARARLWVEETLLGLGDGLAENEIAGAKFRLSGGGSVKRLEMGDLNGIWTREGQ
jgi:hypothetical protein